MQKLFSTLMAGVIFLSMGVVGFAAVENDPGATDYRRDTASGSPVSPPPNSAGDGLPSTLSPEMESFFDNAPGADRGVDANVVDNIHVLSNDPGVQHARRDLENANSELAAAQVDRDVALGDQKKGLEALQNAQEKLKSETTDAKKEELQNLIKDIEAELEKVNDELYAANEKVYESLNKVSESQRDLDVAQQNALDQHHANRLSVLPSTSTSLKDCNVVMNEVNFKSADSKERFKKREDEYIQNVLGCAIKTGGMKLWMIPYYIRFILEFILQLGGLIAVAGIIYGGYLYMFSSVTDDKDRGKKAIIYAVGGIVLMMVAWAFVNIVISILTI